MPGIRIKDGESFENALRRFKKQVEKTGILSEIPRREHNEKPSIKKKNKEIDLRKKLSDDDIFKVIQGMVKKGEESVDQFQVGGRMDLVEKERKEIEILKSFLPEPLSREEMLSIIDETIKETQASSLKDLGKIMKSVMA